MFFSTKRLLFILLFFGTVFIVPAKSLATQSLLDGTFIGPQDSAISVGDFGRDYQLIVISGRNGGRWYSYRLIYQKSSGDYYLPRTKLPMPSPVFNSRRHRRFKKTSRTKGSWNIVDLDLDFTENNIAHRIRLVLRRDNLAIAAADVTLKPLQSHSPIGAPLRHRRLHTHSVVLQRGCERFLLN